MTDAKFNHEDMFRALVREELERAGRRNNSKRVTFQEDERKHWVGWLPSELGRRADQIKKFVEVLYEDNEKKPQLKHYTPHGIPHCKAVEDNLHRLIPNELHKQLTEKEKFFLIIAAWVQRHWNAARHFSRGSLSFSRRFYP